MRLGTKTLLWELILMTGTVMVCSAQSNRDNNLMPMNCSTAVQPSNCTSYLYFSGDGSQPLSEIAKNFNVSTTDILYPQQRVPNHYMIRKPCGCDGGAFFANASYTPTVDDSIFNLGELELSQNYYDGLVYMQTTPSNPPVVILGQTMDFQLICGCPSEGWNTMVTYIIQNGDTALSSLVQNFTSNESDILTLNPNYEMKHWFNLFIPTNFTPSVTASANVPPDATSPKSGKKNSSLLAGIVAALSVFLLLCLIAGCVCWWRRRKHVGVYSRTIIDHSGQTVSSSAELSKIQKPGRLGFLKGCFDFHAPTSRKNRNVKRGISLPKEAMDVFDQEKPVVFSYDEIIEATDHLDESKKLGHGAYGVVYSGFLREQNVAIKQMKTTKTKEFYAELKVLCKVHHANLIELIGYASGEENLFLVYEFAENGALSELLHSNTSRLQGIPPLSWVARMQIALDAARGLEYLHVHTKDKYIHRDVKTSNILLDEFFRAKVADFGLAKLVEQNSENFMTTTRVVGTFGYMPPECMQGRKATAKGDVFAFGVVLCELITGQHAMERTSNGRRSLVGFMVDVLKEGNDPKKRFQSAIDPAIRSSFPLEWSFKTAKLARACVEDDPAARPDMRQIVFALSQLLMASIEWEASLGGSSQIFTGLREGR